MEETLTVLFSPPTSPVWASWSKAEFLSMTIPLVLVVGFLGLLFLFPSMFVRLWLWFLARTLYRLRLLGRDHVPQEGPVLFVCAPVNYLDCLLVWSALTRATQVRLVMPQGWGTQGGGAAPGNLSRWWARLLLKSTRALIWEGLAEPDTSFLSGKEQREDLVTRICQCLERGERLCLFVGNLRTTQYSAGKAFTEEIPFGELLDAITHKVCVPLVPVCLSQRWGSLYKLKENGFRWLFPQETPYPVCVDVAPPLPGNTPASVVCQTVQMFSADCAIWHLSERRPVHRQFVRSAARWPLRNCIIDNNLGGKQLTYDHTYLGSVCLVRLLNPILGDTGKVGLWLPPSAGSVLANIALAMMGKTSVNLNYTAGRESVLSALKQCGARHVITSRRFCARVPLFDQDVASSSEVDLIYLEDLLPRVTRWQKWRAMLAVLLLPGWVLEHWVLGLGKHSLDSLATVIFSSGSTGDPKGVMLSHGNIAANLASLIEVACLGKHDRLLGVLPFFHSFGYTVTLWGPLQVGASSVYHADPRQAKEIGELCRQHRCTLYLTTATFLRFCLKRCTEQDFASVRLLICGAEKLPVSLAETFQQRLGVLPLEGYGCTELSPVVATNLPDLTNPLGTANSTCTLVRNRPGTVGCPIPGVAARVVDPDTGETLPPGTNGLLMIYGPNVMQGYLGREKQTAEVLHEGWYVTGDMAYIDTEGYITLTGRLSRFAKIGGEMVPLERVEEELHEVLGANDRVCTVTCVNDDARGERLIVLYVGVQLEEHGLETRLWWQRLTNKGLPNLWVPAERDFFEIPELPLLGSGKVNLQRVKEIAVELAQR